MTYRIASVTLALLLAACQQGASDQNIAVDGGNQADNAVETLPPDEGNSATEAANADTPPVLNEAEDDSENSPLPEVIPAQYRGRWGINLADCDPKRADNKGLITIGEKSIKFYESVGSLQEIRPAIATSFSAAYSFTGEGQQWERVETLTRTGDKLLRRSTTTRGELGDGLTYTRCK